jgi:hypothetical protein
MTKVIKILLEVVLTAQKKIAAPDYNLDQGR